MNFLYFFRIVTVKITSSEASIKLTYIVDSKLRKLIFISRIIENYQCQQLDANKTWKIFQSIRKSNAFERLHKSVEHSS